MLKAMLIENISRNGTFSKNELDYYDQIFEEYELKNI
jgi:phosphoribosylformimino-5-aminoimidazole carboxamide ribonucleotide (ProFAR) isomerase